MAKKTIAYSRYINSISRARQPSLIREMTKILSTASPDMIPLSGGLPNPKLFPFKEMTVSVADAEPISLSGSGMEQALQYLPTGGLPNLLVQLKELQLEMHKPPADTWANSDIVVTSGSQDGLCKCLELLLEPEGLSSVILEDFVYSGTLAIINPYKPKYFMVESDVQGMRPDCLEKVLSKWRPADMDTDATFPKFLYINPTGANPTGTVLPADRRRQIYELCSRYNLLILEDDPYFYLQFLPPEERPPSFFSLDTDGRVVRFDSFSKILSSGIRLGFVTGPKPIVERIVLHMQVSVLHASSLSQVLVTELLKQWGLDGFKRHIQKVETFYKRRRDAILTAADKHLGGYCEYGVPLGGMFLWIKVPKLETTWDMIMERGLAKNIMLMPGAAFQPTNDRPCQYLRAAFSVAPEEKFDAAMVRLADLIKHELELQQSQTR